MLEGEIVEDFMVQVTLQGSSNSISGNDSARGDFKSVPAVCNYGSRSNSCSTGLAKLPVSGTNLRLVRFVRTTLEGVWIA